VPPRSEGELQRKLEKRASGVKFWKNLGKLIRPSAEELSFTHDSTAPVRVAVRIRIGRSVEQIENVGTKLQGLPFSNLGALE